MKWNHDLIFFDLETTDQEPHRLLQIGACYLPKTNVFSWDGPTATYASFVRSADPSEVSEFVTELTGITPEIVAESRPVDVVLTEFESWIIQYCTKISKPRLAYWGGGGFDVRVLRAEYERLERRFPFSGTMFDVKTLAAVWLGLSHQRNDELGLETVVEKMQGHGDYLWHDAMHDAAATAEVFQHVLRSLSTGMFLPNGQRLQVVAESGRPS